MSRLHAVPLAVALLCAPVRAQAPAAPVDDDVRRLLLRLAPVPLPHARPITSVTFGPDGRTVTTVSNAEGKVCVWDSATGERLREWQLPDKRVVRSAVGAGGKLLATG